MTSFMKMLFAMGYLVVLASMICAGTYVTLGLPVTSKLISLMLFSVGFICFERISKMCGVYK